MPNVEQSGVVLALADALHNHGSWTGETHLQKAGYLLQHLLRVPLRFKFILYKHGPFSFDLRGAMSEMEAEELIRWEPKPYPYGPSLERGPRAEYILGISRMPKAFQRQIDFTAAKLAGKNVAALERLATALYVSLDSGPTAVSRAQRIHKVKPHVSLLEAEAAVKEMDRICEEAVQNGLIVQAN